MTDNTIAEAIFSTQFPVRIYMDENENPWFCHLDVCNVLGYKNSSKALKDHCKEKGVTIRYPLTSGGKQGIKFINEGNLYRLIVKSRKPEAEQFETWVFDDVLPTIRKTGKYELPEAETAISAKQLQTIREAVANCTRFMKVGGSQSLAQTMYRNLKKELGYTNIEFMPAEKHQTALDWIKSHELLCHQYYMAMCAIERQFLKLVKTGDFEQAAEMNVEALSTFRMQQPRALEQTSARLH